jgi:hypothetical protein
MTESVICHLISVICLLREETDRAVQKANTLEAGPMMESVICHLISDICLLREETDRAVRSQTPWRRQPT